MNQNQIKILINEHLNKSNVERADIYFEENEIIRVQVISHRFNNMRLLKRIELLSNIFMPLANKELYDYHLIFNPITKEEII